MSSGVQTDERNIGPVAGLTAKALVAPLVAALWVLLGASGGATIFTPITDRDLAAQAPVIIQAAVLASEPAPTASTPSTDTFVQVEKVLKGYVAGSTVVVRVPGGVGPNGVGLQVWGAPGFRAGERVILFLVPRSDGTYSILHLALGAFHEVRAGERSLAIRHLSGATAIGQGAATVSSVDGEESLRDFAAFALWLSEIGGLPAVSAGAIPTGYLIRREDLPTLPPADVSGRTTEACTGFGFRWFEFDRGRRVKWWIDPRGYVGAGTGIAELDHARAIWRDASDSRVRLTGAGVSWSRRGLAAPDGVNALLFEDPGSWIPGEYTCTAGGVLAVTGVWFDSGLDQDCQLREQGQKGRHGGRTYLKILGADIVTNNGSACHLSSGPMSATEVFAHGLGHALGLADANESAALMHSRAGDGARPLLPGSSDLDALQRLYPPR